MVNAATGMNREAARAWITGVAHVLPDWIVTNDKLPASLRVDADGIFKRTGIRARHWAPVGVSTSDLGAEAAKKVLADTGTPLGDIDCLIAATQSPDHFLPGIGVLIQAKLGLADIPCFDIRDQCSGFLYALQAARAFVETRAYARILIVCAEVHSHGLGRDPEDAHVTPLFGDGAAAVIVEAEPRGERPLAPVWQLLGADGRGVPKLRHRLWDISLEPPWDPRMFNEPAHQVQFPEMDGEAVFRTAVKRMVQGVQACFKTLDLGVADIDWFLPHQANANITKTVGSILGFPGEKTLTNIDRVGNCSGASIPILLSESLRRIGRGQRVLTVAFGAGFTWGAALMESAP